MTFFSRQNASSQMATSNSPPDAFLECSDIAQQIVDKLGCAAAVLSVSDGSSMVFCGQVGFFPANDQTRNVLKRETVCQYTAALQSTLRISDMRQTPALRDLPVVRKLGFVAYLGAAVHDRKRKAIGSVCALHMSRRKWTDAEAHYLEDIAKQFGARVEIAIKDREYSALCREYNQTDQVLSAISQIAGTAVTIRNAEGDLVYANRGTEDLLGITRAQLEEMRWIDLFHPDDCPMIAKMRERAGPNSPAVGMLVRIRHARHGWIWSDLSLIRTADNLTAFSWQPSFRETRDMVN